MPLGKSPRAGGGEPADYPRWVERPRPPGLPLTPNQSIVTTFPKITRVSGSRAAPRHAKSTPPSHASTFMRASSGRC